MKCLAGTAPSVLGPTTRRPVASTTARKRVLVEHHDENTIAARVPCRAAAVKAAGTSAPGMGDQREIGRLWLAQRKSGIGANALHGRVTRELMSKTGPGELPEQQKAQQLCL